MSSKKREVTYDIRSLQLLILETLLAVDKVCKEHNLRYYIIAGTLLGAVRHKGFIPWDDDLDIAMPREDYDQLIKYSKEWLPDPYEFVCGENDNKYTLSFGKIQNANTTLVERVGLVYLGGAFIDVFPLDGVPESKSAQKWHFFKYKFYRKILYFHYRDPFKHGKNFRAIPTLIIRKLTNTKKTHRKLRGILTKYKFKDSSLIADYDDYSRGIMNKDLLGEPTPILFEGKEVWGLKNYDAYLQNKYGNYMEIPDKSKQRQHQFYYLDLNTPYRSVKNMDDILNEIKKA